MIEYDDTCLCAPNRWSWSVMLDGKLDPDTGLLYHGYRNPCGKLFPGHYQTEKNLYHKRNQELQDQEYADWFCT